MMERAFERVDQNHDDMVGPREFGRAMRRVMARRTDGDGPCPQAGPCNDGGPRPQARQARLGPQGREDRPALGQGPELRFQRAFERALAQTLRRHRAELNQMFREAVEQAMREVGCGPAMDGPCKSGDMERGLRQGRERRGGEPAFGPRSQRDNMPQRDGPRGAPGMCPKCKQKCVEKPGAKMGRCDGPCAPDKCGSPCEGQRVGKGWDDRKANPDRQMRRPKADREECAKPDGFRGTPGKAGERDKNCGDRQDRRELKKGDRPRKAQQDDCDDDDSPDDADD